MSAFDAAVTNVLEKISHAKIDERPFPHIVVSEIFPQDYYDALVKQIPDRSVFTRATYPGTGVGNGGSDYGLVLDNLEHFSELRKLSNFVRSETFSRCLLDKFSRFQRSGETQPEAIPEDKWQYFQDGKT